MTRIGSLFSGYGGLDMAAAAYFGGTVAWHSDIDPGANLILAHRYPKIPNHGDLTRIDWSAVEPVDVLTGGFPCQDVSHAGKRAGLRPDTRSGLWTHMAYAVDQLRPRYVVAENVRGLLSARAASDVEPCPWCLGGAADGEPDLRALGAVLGDLAELGYDARWLGLRASDVGAPHGRFRVFVVATDTLSGGFNGRASEPIGGSFARVAAAGGGPDTAADSERSGRDGRPGQLGPGRRPEPQDSSHPAANPDGPGLEGRGASGSWAERSEPVRGGCTAADATGDRRDEGRAEPARLIGRSDAAQRGDAAPDADSDGREGLGWLNPLEYDADGRGRADRPRDEVERQAWGAYEPAIRRWEHALRRVAPAPTETSPRGTQRLSPRFVEWMMGLPAGHVTDVPGLGRNAQLKALGNGVVPQQAHAALQVLLGGAS